MKRTWLTRNVLVLGVVSLLNDSASEMAMPLLPAFLTGVLHAGAFALGWIEGLADFVASVLKLFSGRWADRLKRHRPFVIAGYTLASCVRPLLALAAAAWQVLLVRVTDRMGKGLRTSPRDAILAASVPASQRGAAYGFHRAMDHTGAVVGPLLAVAILALWPGDLRLVFWLAAIPSALVIAVVVVGVREAAPAAEAAAPPTGVAAAPVAASPARSLLRFLVPLGLFTLGNSSDVFLLLKAGATDIPLYGLPLLWMAFHVVKAVTSVGGGFLADRLGRRRMILFGWMVYAAVYAGFAFAQTQAAVLALFLVYGCYHGLSEGAEKALVAEISPPESRGSAFGWYHLTVGLLTLPASVLFGALWEAFGDPVAFLTGAGLAFLGIVLLLVLKPRPEGERADLL